jgi:hypothetical protein
MAAPAGLDLVVGGAFDGGSKQIIETISGTQDPVLWEISQGL